MTTNVPRLTAGIDRSKLDESDMTGRPLKLLEADIRDRFLTAIRTGAPQDTACDYAGITRTAITRTRKKVEALGHEGPEDCDKLCFPVCQFFRDYALARSEARMKALKKIQDSDEWQSAAWYLERTDPANFAKTERLQVTTNAEDKLENDLTDEQKRVMGQAFLATLGAADLIRSIAAATVAANVPALPATPIDAEEAETLPETTGADPQ